MIRVHVEGGRAVRAEGVPAGAAAYLDAGWLPREDADVPAIVADESGIRWDDHAPVPLSGDRDEAAAAALRAVAAEAVSRVPEGSGPVKVLGQGLVAAEARRLLPAAAGSEDARPRCVIDTTGDPETVVEALAELEDLGTLVAAGPLGGRGLPLNLYADVHLRGLTIVGVAPPLPGGAPAPAPGTAAGTEPVVARAGAPLGAGQWFRVEA